MPGQQLDPLLLVKFALWIAIVAISTVLLRRRRVTARARLAFLAGGVLLFGFIFGWLVRNGINPDPVFSLRNLLSFMLVQRRIVIPVAAMLVILLALVWISNKSICGWGCQLGLLQDLLHRTPLPKWKPPFWLANTVRIVAFVMLVAGLVAWGVDWIGVVNPFAIFQLNLTLWTALFSAGVLVASLFVYRPWCRFFCPFGLLGWVVEQVSLLRPRINRQACKKCKLCVKACPTQAMSDYYEGKRLHADCFACGSCISACPQKDALGWRVRI